MSVCVCVCVKSQVAMIQPCRTGQFQVHDTLPLRLRHMQGLLGWCSGQADRYDKASTARVRLDIEVEGGVVETWLLGQTERPRIRLTRDSMGHCAMFQMVAKIWMIG